MKTTLIVIEDDADLAEAQKLLQDLMRQPILDAAATARLRAQAQLIEAYEKSRWPARKLKPADLLRYLMEQHDLSRADLVPLLGSASRVSEVLNGRKGLSLNMVQRLRARFGIPADLLLPPPEAKPRQAA